MPSWALDVPLPRTQAERLIAARVGVPDPPGHHLLALARDPDGYASLCRVISKAQLRGGAKGRPVYDLDEITAAADGHWLVLTGCRKGAVRQALDTRRFEPGRALDELIARFGRDNVVVELTHELDPLADERYDALYDLARERRLQIVATTAAHYHAPPRRPLATALAAVRARSSLDEIDGWLPSWAGQHLRSGDEMAAAVRPLARRGRSGAPARQRDRLPAQADRARSATVPRPARPRRDVLPARADLRAATTSGSPASRTRHAHAR